MLRATRRHRPKPARALCVSAFYFDRLRHLRSHIESRFAGLTKSRSRPATAGSSVWLYRYDKRPGQWVKVMSHLMGPAHAIASDSEEPRARCAHQVVYDANAKTFYMHGGNAGFAYGAAQHQGANVDVSVESENRLDDFWSMTLKRCDGFFFVR